MEAANVNIDVNDFAPAKALKSSKNKRKSSQAGDAMDLEVAEHRGIQGRRKNAGPKSKKVKKAEDNESDKDMRKIPVPAHRLYFNIQLS